MFSLKYIIFIPFVCPNPSHPSLRWDWSVLDAKWEIYLYGILLINIIALLWFYFMTKPNPAGVKRFFYITLLIFIIGGASACLFLYQSKDILSIENANWTYEHTLIVAFAGLISTFEAFFISILIFLLMSQIPIHWNIRAMRRYPFKFIP